MFKSLVLPLWIATVLVASSQNISLETEKHCNCLVYRNGSEQCEGSPGEYGSCRCFCGENDKWCLYLKRCDQTEGSCTSDCSDLKEKWCISNKENCQMKTMSSAETQLPLVIGLGAGGGVLVCLVAAGIAVLIHRRNKKKAIYYIDENHVMRNWNGGV